MESLVIVTFLFFQCVESHMVTRVPSPTISIAKRTALCLPMNSLRKQNTRVSLGNKPFSGLRTWQDTTQSDSTSPSERVMLNKPEILRRIFDKVSQLLDSGLKWL